MSIHGLDHINIVVGEAELTHTLTFYVDVLGLKVGPRPDFDNKGFWLYAGSNAIVHLNLAEVPKVTEENAFGHIALKASDVTEVKRRLAGQGILFQQSVVIATGQTQLFLRDPSGIRIELNFDEVADC